MAWTTPVLSATGDLISAALYRINYDNLRYLKGLDGDITLSDHIVGTAYAGFAGGIGTHTHASAGAEGGILSSLSRGMAYGNYTGNDGVNRDIAHGLDKPPIAVFIMSTAGTWHLIHGTTTAIFYLADDTHGYLTVTQIGATNFYVGNATSYLYSGNASTVTYYWIAIG